MASKSQALYVWVTSDLINRVFKHKHWTIEWHTKKYNIDRLVYYESWDDIMWAIEREKQIKKWSRKKKIALIEKNNTAWEDLSKNLM